MRDIVRAVARVTPPRDNVFALPDRRRSVSAEPHVWGSAVTPVAPATESQPVDRYGQLDAQRGVAALCIVIFTVYQFCNVDHFLYRGTLAYTVLGSLDAAVPWFFVISGFLLFQPVARGVLCGSPTSSARRFLSRRVVKLIPAYYIVVLVVWFSRQQSLPGDWRDLIEHLTFTQVFDEKRIFYTNGPAWAVSVAVYCYLIMAGLSFVLPLTARRLKTRKRGIWLLVATVLAMASVSLGWKGYSYGIAHHTTLDSFTSWFGPLSNLDNFAAGMGVAVLIVVLEPRRGLSPRECLGLRALAFAVLAEAFAGRQAAGWSGVYFTVECSVGFACLVAAATTQTSSAASSRRWRPLTRLGTVSYGIYLWNEPMLLALNGWHNVVRQAPDALLQDEVVVLALSIVAGSLSYIAIERPMRQLVSLFMRRNPASARPIES